MLVLGAWNFFSTRPALAQAATLQPALAAALRRIGAESIFGVLVLCVTGFLSVLPPAAHGLHEEAHAASGSHSNHATKKLAPAEGASLRILSPQDGQVFKGDQIPVSFRLVKGKRAEHVHAYVDGALMGMFKGNKGTLTGVAPGKHRLELRPVTKDHTTELDATASVQFAVR